MLGDIRYALRTFAKHRSFAIAAISALALGIAVNTIAFSLLNSLALRPMPVRDASRVVRRIVLLVVRDGWRLVGKGLAAGAACSLITAPVLGRLLFDISAFDPGTMVAVPLLLAVVALAACCVPARRPARLQPLAVLRVD
jgi:putative ABC transport system permease protein